MVMVPCGRWFADDCPVPTLCNLYGGLTVADCHAGGLRVKPMQKYMEEDLDRPVNSVLETMQRRIMHESTYFGIKTLKSPTDFWVYQELIYAARPDVVVEIGNYHGGSALALAHLLDAMDHGRVIAVDIDHSPIAESARCHPRITFIEGDACEVFQSVKSLVSAGDRVMVIEDSSHEFENTLNTLNTYQSLLGKDDFFIVEDTICHHGLSVGPKPGPYEAVEAFISSNKSFAIDRCKESFLITWNPKGYLKRISD